MASGHISQAPNDQRELEPTLDHLEQLPEQLGDSERIAADNGYYSQQNTKEVEGRGMIPYLATGRQNQ